MSTIDTQGVAPRGALDWADRMRTSTRSRLQPLLDEQADVITSAQLSALRVDPELPRREGWVLLAPRTWCTSAEPADEQLLQGLVLHTRRTGVPSGALACRMHGLRDVPERDVADVLTPHGRRLASGGLTVVHQSKRLPKAVRRKGWKVAPAARAVADAARWSGELRPVRALVLAALSDLLVRPADLVEERRLGQARGRGVLTQALDDWSAGACSAPEAEVADALRALPCGLRLPPFLLNPDLWIDGRHLGRPDGYLPGHGIGWEVDSVRHHGGSEELAATLDRHAGFADAGIELVHVVPTVFRRDPAGWAAHFATRALEKATLGHGEPVGLYVRPHDARLPSAGPAAA